MLKNRAFLIGLGAGIILGALLFQLMLSGEQSRQRLGQFVNEADEKLYTRAEVDALLKAERDKVQLDQETKAEPEKLKEQPAAAAEPVEGAAPTTVQVTKQAATKHIIRIEAGLGLAKTAELLAAQNIIHDEAAFISHMIKSKQLVRAGYFLFQENMTADNAIAVVTGEPLTKKQTDAIMASNKAN